MIYLGPVQCSLGPEHLLIGELTADWERGQMVLGVHRVLLHHLVHSQHHMYAERVSWEATLSRGYTLQSSAAVHSLETTMIFL